LNYEELKEHCSKKIVSLYKENKIDKDFIIRYKEEIRIAKRFYDNGRNLYDELSANKERLDERYTIPYLCGFTSSVLDLPPEFIQVKDIVGSPDYDADMSPSGKEAVKKYLIEKYGADRCIPVGAFSTFGPASAAKDLLRVYSVDFKKSNDFTIALDSSLSWEENLEMLKASNEKQYKFYLANREALDKVPFFVDKIRQTSVHAGGLAIVDAPIYKRCPVDRVGDQIVTAFPESGSEATLDEIGVIKLDNLSVSILDVIKSAIEMVNEKMFLIVENGITKIVPQSYIDKEINRI